MTNATDPVHNERSAALSAIRAAVIVWVVRVGAFAMALVDYESGLTLGSRGGSPEFDSDVAAPGNSDVVRTNFEVIEKLGMRESIEDVLITLDTQYHLIRLIRGQSNEKLFFYLVLNRAEANLALARRDLRVIEESFYLANPGAKPANPRAKPVVGAHMAEKKSYFSSNSPAVTPQR